VRCLKSWTIGRPIYILMYMQNSYVNINQVPGRVIDVAEDSIAVTQSEVCVNPDSYFTPTRNKVEGVPTSHVRIIIDSSEGQNSSVK
jgi:hypothetical protein